MKKWYTYKDLETGKIRRTSGEFECWSERTGILNVRYAIFKTRRTRVYVPFYLLTQETRDAIPPKPTDDEEEVL